MHRSNDVFLEVLWELDVVLQMFWSIENAVLLLKKTVIELDQIEGSSFQPVCVFPMISFKRKE